MREHIKERSELAHTYACDGAYHTAAQILEDLATTVRQHADRNSAMINDMIKRGPGARIVPTDSGPMIVNITSEPIRTVDRYEPVTCMSCAGNGCRVCSGRGEIMRLIKPPV